LSSKNASPPCLRHAPSLLLDLDDPWRRERPALLLKSDVQRDRRADISKHSDPDPLRVVDHLVQVAPNLEQHGEDGPESTYGEELDNHVDDAQSTAGLFCLFHVAVVIA